MYKDEYDSGEYCSILPVWYIFLRKTSLAFMFVFSHDSVPNITSGLMWSTKAVNSTLLLTIGSGYGDFVSWLSLTRGCRRFCFLRTSAFFCLAGGFRDSVTHFVISLALDFGLLP